jgi:hypothetical protein
MDASAHFDVSAWVVWESFSQGEFARAASITTADRAGLAGTHRRDAALRLYVPSDLSRRMDVLRTREHEWTHFRQHISTPFGLFHYRLNGLNEYLVQAFYRARPEHEGPLYFAVAEAREREAADSDATGILAAWQAARVVGQALWSGDIPLRVLTELWDLCVQLQERLPAYPADGKGPRLTSTRGPDEGSCPSGWITCEQLVEGFASYREAMELSVHFPLEDFIGHVHRNRSLEARHVHDFLAEVLEIPFEHPLAGALLELAVATFVDPLLAGEPEEPLVWEWIHPGARFMTAVRTIDRLGKPYPTSIATAYDYALAAFGLDHTWQDSPQWLAARAGPDLIKNRAEPGPGTSVATSGVRKLRRSDVRWRCESIMPTPTTHRRRSLACTTTQTLGTPSCMIRGHLSWSLLKACPSDGERAMISIG